MLTRVLVFQAVQGVGCIMRLARVCPRNVKASVSSLAGYQPAVAGLPSGTRKLVHPLAFQLLGAVAESLVAWRPAGLPQSTLHYEDNSSFCFTRPYFSESEMRRLHGLTDFAIAPLHPQGARMAFLEAPSVYLAVSHPSGTSGTSVFVNLYLCILIRCI